VPLFLLAPFLLEWQAVAVLREKGIDVESLTVEKTGLTGSRLGPGELRLNEHSLLWESIAVGYVPSRLLTGSLDHLIVNSPTVRLRLPDIPMPVPSPAVEEVPAYPLEDVPLAREDVPEADESAPQPVKVADADKEALVPPFVVETPLPVKTGEQAVHELIRKLPFRNGFIGNVRFELDWYGSMLLSTEWDGHFVNDPEQFNGMLRIKSELLSSILTLRESNLTSDISLFGEMEVRPAPLMELIGKIPMETGINMALVESLGIESPFKGEFLAESIDGGAMQMSGLLSTESLSWQSSFMPLPIHLRNALFLGTWRNGTASFEGGGRIDSYVFKDLSIESFGIHFSWNPSGPIKLETEKIDINWKGWAGEAAVRLRANMDGVDEKAPARMELAFNQVDGPLVHIQPASLLLEVESSAFRLSSSALGLERDSVIWIEELAGMITVPDSMFTSGFTWYSAAGAHMGDARIEGSLADRGGLSASVELIYPDGTVFLNSDIYESSDELEISLAGELSNKWLNALGRWWWGRVATLSGQSPAVEARLSRAGYLLKGDIRLILDSLNLSFADGPVIEGITGNLGFKVNGLPFSDGEQRLRIQSLTTGNVRVNDLIIDWSLPTFRNLRINRVTAELDDGKVFMDPFMVDLAKPDVETALHFELIPVQQFLDWLGEKRFALQGTVTGTIPLRWKSGVLYVGEADLRMDSSTTINRFLFSDEAFLEQQFASMSGVSADLKEPLLATLLEDGIRIRDLTLALVPDKEKGEVVLKLQVSGETKSKSMEVPIESLIINNVISDEDLRHFLRLLGPIEFLSLP
jgi:hypothetical protein